jgi:hypothetical protein
VIVAQQRYAFFSFLNNLSLVTTPDPTPEREEEKPAPHFRQAPSRNQRQRSKLQQLPEEPSAPATKPEPAPAPPVALPPAPLLRHTRLKRSGHMHEDLSKPIPEEKPRESEY